MQGTFSPDSINHYCYVLQQSSGVRVAAKHTVTRARSELGALLSMRSHIKLLGVVSCCPRREAILCSKSSLGA